MQSSSVERHGQMIVADMC